MIDCRRIALVGAALWCAALQWNCHPAASVADDIPIFVPDHAQNLLRAEQRLGVHEIHYTVAEAYPAPRFLCELTNFLASRHWRGIRNDALNPNIPSSLVRGWTDFTNAVHKPETHVHAWSAWWLDDAGDVATYAVSYEYPEGGTPAMTTLKATALVWPSAIAKTQFGDSMTRLQTVAIRDATPCDPPEWSLFVRASVADPPPVLALPSEALHVRSLQIARDIDGLADRIAAAVKVARPDLVVSTFSDPSTESPDAVLNFRAECRCNQGAAPNGFYVAEAVLSVEPFGDGWHEPARVLFYWSDAGDPPWKHVAPECFRPGGDNATCQAAFKKADIDFTDALAMALK